MLVVLSWDLGVSIGHISGKVIYKKTNYTALLVIQGSDIYGFDLNRALLFILPSHNNQVIVERLFIFLRILYD